MTENDKEKLTDEEIVIKTRSVDSGFYAVIMERYQDKLLRYASNLVKDEDKAADIVQAAFIKAYINLNGFDTKKKFSSWVYRIVHNEAINFIEKFKKEIAIPENIDFKSEEDIEKNFEQKETIIKVQECLKKMPVMYAEPLTLYYIEEKSYKDISDILRIPMGTVATRISQAKILMKKICQKN